MHDPKWNAILVKNGICAIAYENAWNRVYPGGVFTSGAVSNSDIELLERGYNAVAKEFENCK